MALTAHLLTTSRSYPELPPVTITGHAFFSFSMAMNNRLIDLEKTFEAETRCLPLSRRNGWSPLPQKPR
jgi:hypothetical protein